MYTRDELSNKVLKPIIFDLVGLYGFEDGYLDVIREEHYLQNSMDMDSFDIMTLVSEIQKRLDIDIPDSALPKLMKDWTYKNLLDATYNTYLIAHKNVPQNAQPTAKTAKTAVAKPTPVVLNNHQDTEKFVRDVFYFVGIPTAKVKPELSLKTMGIDYIEALDIIQQLEKKAQLKPYAIASEIEQKYKRTNHLYIYTLPTFNDLINIIMKLRGIQEPVVANAMQGFEQTKQMIGSAQGTQITK